MSGNVIRLGFYRAVFVLLERAGVTVLMASQGSPKVRIAHERHFSEPEPALKYAQELAKSFDCRVTGAGAAVDSEGVA
jgi:hypothetical protein